MHLSRRSILKSLGVGALGLSATSLLGDERKTLPVAAVVTCYKKNSHADVLIGKILEGWRQDGGDGPRLKLVSMYVDQTPQNDLSQTLAKKHDFRLAKTIDEAVTLGENKLPVAGVISVAEHGDYAKVERTGQTKYPRRRFFDEIVAAMRRVDDVAPIFSDKHLSYNWQDAKHMFEVARQRKIPFMAGSSLPVAWRYPSQLVPLGSDIKEAIALGYGGRESYGFHALEALQSIVERRRGGESGVRAVTAWRADQIAPAAQRGAFSRELLVAAAAAAGETLGPWSDHISDKSAVYQIEYRDGFRASVAMLRKLGGKFAVACKLKQQPKPIANWVRLEMKPPWGHFAYLLRAIEAMIHSGRTPYPIERTLLTTGILDRAMHSYADGGKRLSTPELNVEYEPSTWKFANQDRENFPE